MTKGIRAPSTKTGFLLPPLADEDRPARRMQVAVADAAREGAATALIAVAAVGCTMDRVVVSSYAREERARSRGERRSVGRI